MTKPVDTKTKTETPSAFRSAPASDNPLAVLEKAVLTPELARLYSRIKANDDLRFAQEKIFFLDMLHRSAREGKDFGIHNATPESLSEAFRQAASIGLSFNPQLGHVYLIPRKAKRGDPNSPLIAYASPGYRGLLHLAVLGGAIKYGRAEVVYERDHFRYFGPTKEPEFIAGGSATVNSLTVKRGAKVGVFCHAKTIDGDDLCDMMDKEAISKVRAKSEQKDSLMWTIFEEEGWKKAILRRASKTWPRAASSALLQRAVEILNDNEGLASNEEEIPEVTRVVSTEQINELHAMLTEAGATNADKWIEALARLFGCAVIADLPADRFDEAKIRLADKIKTIKEKANAHA
jgi:recombinational DNA repair protein RecT